MIMDYAKIDNIRMGDMHKFDYPRFCDAFIDSADYDGKPMTEGQLDEINEDLDFVHQAALDSLH